MATRKPGTTKKTFFSKKVTAFLPTRAGWRQAIRMTLAALAAYFGTALVGLNHGYWAVITCLIIVQGSLGATIAAGITRVAGTAAGAFIGGLGVFFVRSYTSTPEWLILLIVIIPLALLASKPIFKLAPLTGALVLLLAGSGNLAFALQRVAEIALGSVIGVLVALLILPERATAILIEHSAAIMDQLGALSALLLSGGDEAARDNITATFRGAFAQIQNDLKEVQNERGARLLRSDPFPDRLTRHLQRLRTDIGMAGRAMALPGEQKLYPELGANIKQQFSNCAIALRNRAPLAPYEPATPDVAPETPLGFALATLQRELIDLTETLNQWAAEKRPEVGRISEA